MKEAFDLRLSKDREALADLLPTIDNQTYSVPRQTFIEALADFSTFLGNPDWMIYQWGSLRPIPAGHSSLVLNLYDACELGGHLKCLSQFANFDKFLEGFLNPTQFQDARFEAKVAYWFTSLKTITNIVFSPKYTIRGRIKRPDFDATSRTGNISIECKQPHIYLQKASQKFQRSVAEFESAMKEKQWPSHLRLEIEFIAPMRESAKTLAQKTLENALKVAENGGEEFFIANTIHGFVVQRKSPFKINNTKFGTDIMILDQDKATGLFNPEFTSLRVVNNRLDAQFTRSLGARIAKALTQLPNTQDCIIFVGDAPYRITKEACQRRLSDPAYRHVRAFGVWDNELKFVFRKSDRDFVDALVRGPSAANN